eukprot:PITA_13513
MMEEYSSIMKNDVWEVVPRLEGKSIVTSRWLYKIKHVADGSIKKFKARLVATGLSQLEGVDYEETFAPVTRYTSIRSIISIAAEMGWKIHQMDVKTAFLNGFIQEEVYIEQPQGFEVDGKESHVSRLKKELYALKQAPRAWYLSVDAYLQQLGFTKSEADLNLYFIVVGGGHFFLVQRKYIVDILSRFHMEDCKPMFTPMFTNWKKLNASDSELVDPTLYRQLIGELMYLVNTPPDICFAVNTLSQFMCEPRRVHWVVAKHILRYMQDIVDFGLDYIQGDEVTLRGEKDSDWAGCASDRNSTSKCCFGLGSTVVLWISWKQQSVSLSSAEAEYMAASLASCEAIWLRKMLFGLFGQALRPSVIYYDDQSCLKLTEIQFFMTGQSILRSSITSLETMSKRELSSLSTFPQMSK